jgi:arylsulfatase
MAASAGAHQSTGAALSESPNAQEEVTMATYSTSLFRNLGILLTSAVLVTLAQTGLAQNVTPSSPGGLLSLPRPDFHFKGEVGRTYLDSDPATFPQIVRPPKGAPNIVLILLDDVGFGQFGVFGGGVPSPNMEKLAAQGLRYNRFHTTALCSPTRAALITGRDHHMSGNGSITEAATGYDG